MGGLQASPISADHVAEVKEILNSIVDPCSAGAATPIGLVDMGIVESVEVEGGVVRIALLPTFAGCLYVGIFKAEIERRMQGIAWCSSLSMQVVDASVLWDESRISDAARRRLEERRAVMRRELKMMNR